MYGDIPVQGRTVTIVSDSVCNMAGSNSPITLTRNSASINTNTGQSNLEVSKGTIATRPSYIKHPSLQPVTDFTPKITSI